MEPVRSSGGGSGNSGTYTPEMMTETLRFEEEIQSLMTDNLIHQGFECSPPVNTGSSSFTALLGLQPNQAVELLHDLDPGPSPSISAARGSFHLGDTKALDHLPFVLRSLSSFPSNAALIERATILSVFASADESPEGSSAIPSNSDEVHPPNLKFEPHDSDSKPQKRSAKRKETEKSTKGKTPLKKGKCFSGDVNGVSSGNLDGDKLPYVHVRARRGQATDSHSLAERARREKINARMKLLQELVPGCSKISGTALVLDEIINHVQSLQRQVEILSMRLAAVNPRIDFTGLDNLLSTEMQCGRVAAAGSGPGWFDGSTNEAVRRNHHCEQQQPIWHVELLNQQEMAGWERDGSQLHHPHHHDFISGSSSGSPPGTSLFRYDSAASAALPLSTASQLKSEM